MPSTSEAVVLPTQPPSSASSAPTSSADMNPVASPTSSSSSSSIICLSRLGCVRAPLLSGWAYALFPFVGYRFLVQARLTELAYQLSATGVSIYIVAAAPSLSILPRLFAIWICARAALTFGLHATYRPLTTYYQHPPRPLRLGRHVMRLVSLGLVAAALQVSSGQADESTAEDAPSMALWGLLLCELVMTLSALVVYALLHLVFRHKQLSTLFPFLQPSLFSYALSSSSPTTPTTTPGLSPADLAHLPSHAYTAELLPSLAEDGCVICQCDVVVGDSVRVLRCGHGFHVECVDVWLVRRAVCPLCVRVVRVVEEEEEGNGGGVGKLGRVEQVELIVQPAGGSEVDVV